MRRWNLLTETTAARLVFNVGSVSRRAAKPRRSQSIANIREGYAATGMANLDWSEIQERAIDKVAAAGRVSAIGVLIWKSKYGLESVAYRELAKQLLVVYRNRYSDRREIAETLVDQALREFVAGQCSLCKGAREVLHSQLMVTCPDCHGSGIRRFSDAERSTSMQMSWGLTKRIGHKITWMLGFLTAEDKAVNQQMSSQLER